VNPQIAAALCLSHRPTAAAEQAMHYPLACQVTLMRQQATSALLTEFQVISIACHPSSGTHQVLRVPRRGDDSSGRARHTVGLGVITWAARGESFVTSLM
jgi:hypothetical protein